MKLKENGGLGLRERKGNWNWKTHTHIEPLCPFHAMALNSCRNTKKTYTNFEKEGDLNWRRLRATHTHWTPTSSSHEGIEFLWSCMENIQILKDKEIEIERKIRTFRKGETHTCIEPMYPLHVMVSSSYKNTTRKTYIQKLK